jgi:hypothetical protein
MFGVQCSVFLNVEFLMFVRDDRARRLVRLRKRLLALPFSAATSRT